MKVMSFYCFEDRSSGACITVFRDNNSRQCFSFSNETHLFTSHLSHLFTLRFFFSPTPSCPFLLIPFRSPSLLLSLSLSLSLFHFPRLRLSLPFHVLSPLFCFPPGDKASRRVTTPSKYCEYCFASSSRLEVLIYTVRRETGRRKGGGGQRDSLISWECSLIGGTRSARAERALSPGETFL